MMIIETSIEWFKIVRVLFFDLEEVSKGNTSYMDKSSSGASQLFNYTLMCTYSHTFHFVFGKISEFKWEFTPLLKDFAIIPIHILIKKYQANALVERLHQIIYNMIITKDIDRKAYDYIYPWVDNLTSIALLIREFYHWTFGFISGKAVFGRDILFNIMLIFIGML